MLHVLTITVPIYLLIACGFLAGRLGEFSRTDMRALGKFVISFALPALLFRALAQRSVAEIVNVGYLAAYAAGSLAVLLSAVAYARFRRGKPMAFSAFYAMGMSFSNSGFVGYPIVLQWLGPTAAVGLALCMLVENLLLLPLTLALAESGADRVEERPRMLAQLLAGVLRNPLIVAIVAGFASAFFGLVLPAPITRAIDLFAMASTAVALFVIGGSLVGLRVRGMIGDLAQIAFGKLLLHPLAVAAMLLLLPPIDPTLRAAAVAFACMPMLSIYPILAQKYQQDGLCAAALLVTTVLSFVTISGFLWIMDATPGWSR